MLKSGDVNIRISPDLYLILRVRISDIQDADAEIVRDRVLVAMRKRLTVA